MAAEEDEMWIDMDLSAVVIHSNKRLHLLWCEGPRRVRWTVFLRANLKV